MSWKFEQVSGPYKVRMGGLAWDGSGMLFSAVSEERIMRFDPASGAVDEFRWWTGKVNGIALASDGSVFGAQEAGRRVVLFKKDGTAVQTQDLLDGAHHNQPVDVAVDTKGSVWIADPYGSEPPYGPPAYPFLPHASVLRMDAYGQNMWRLTRVTKDTTAPRAILLSADEKTLYVADGDIARGDVCQLHAYPLNDHRSAGTRRTLLNLAFGERGIEGMCLDIDGNIIACMGWSQSGKPPSIVVISPVGTIIETHPSPADMPMRCAFGDDNLASLYVSSGDGGLYRAQDIGRRGLVRKR